MSALSIYALKPRFQALLRPLAGALARGGVTANQVTVAAAGLSVALGAYVAWRAPEPRPFLWLPFWMFVRMALNAIDGMLAREFGQASALGAYLNELSDILSDAALYLPFAFVAPFGPWSIGTVILAACVSEMAGALGPVVGSQRRYDGPMGKSDRALAFGALGLCIGLVGPLPPLFFWTMPAIALLIGWNIVNRVCRGAAAAPRRMR